MKQNNINLHAIIIEEMMKICLPHLKEMASAVEHLDFSKELRPENLPQDLRHTLKEMNAKIFLRITEFYYE